jgi:hypothetical protein
MPFRTTDISNGLEHKFGFVQEKGNHLFFRRVFPSGLCIRTKVSHGRKEVSAKIEGYIARQLGVDTRFFRGMISCTRSKEEYEQKVAERPANMP